MVESAEESTLEVETGTEGEILEEVEEEVEESVIEVVLSEEPATSQEFEIESD